MKYTMLLLLLLIGSYVAVDSQVVEVDDSFHEKKQNFAWLLEFYAPWCGHCRRLEPTYHQVYLALKGSPIIIAKVDATKYPSVASAYDVRGYPTIKFIQGDKVITYNGDRTKEDIIEFSKKAFGPSISPINDLDKFLDIRQHLYQNVFFTFVLHSLEAPDSDPDFVVFKQVADRYAISSSFFLIQRDSLPQDTLLSKIPCILVWKDGHYLEYQGPTNNLEKWVNMERFSVFPVIGGIGLNEMSSLDKMLVIYVHHQVGEWNKIILDVAQNKKYKSDRYQFVWLKDVDVGNNIMMSNMDPPFLFVLNTSDHHFYSFASRSFTEKSLVEFLEDVEVGKYEAQGGRGWSERFKRLVYDVATTMHGIYKESVWLALLVFGVPLLVISIIFYTLCCIEPIDDVVAEESYEDDYQGDLFKDDDNKKIQ